MAGGWDSNGYTIPSSGAGTTFDAVLSKMKDGLNAATSMYAGSVDPSSGAGWGADQVGRRWLDTSDEYNPVLKEWNRYDTGGTDYAWRPVNLRRVFVPEPEATVTMPWSSPAAADAGWSTLSLATLIGTKQNATFQSSKAVEVVLEVELTPGASETLGAANCYLAFRKKGGTGDRRVYAQVAGRPTRAEITVPLDSAEDLETKIVVGGGTPSLAFAVKLVEVREACA